MWYGFFRGIDLGIDVSLLSGQFQMSFDFSRGAESPEIAGVSPVGDFVHGMVLFVTKLDPGATVTSPEIRIWKPSWRVWCNQERL